MNGQAFAQKRELSYMDVILIIDDVSFGTPDDYYAIDESGIRLASNYDLIGMTKQELQTYAEWREDAQLSLPCTPKELYDWRGRNAKDCVVVRDRDSNDCIVVRDRNAKEYIIKLDLPFLDGFVEAMEQQQEPAKSIDDQREDSYISWLKDNPNHATMTKAEIHDNLKEFDSDRWGCSTESFNRWWRKDPNRKRPKGRHCRQN